VVPLMLLKRGLESLKHLTLLAATLDQISKVLQISLLDP
jgi:hypothetical protein